MENPDFLPGGLLAHRHVQSVLASRPPRRGRVRRSWEAFGPENRDIVVDCGAGVRLLGHHSPARPGGHGGLAVLLHGWEGSADSVYLLSTAMALLESGYAVFRLNLRDHGDSHHLNEDLFHSCRLDEVIGAVRWIGNHYRPSSLSLAGFSLGGNFALRVAAAAGPELSVARVVAACPVLDPVRTLEALDFGWPVYRHFFIRKWRNSLLKKQQCFPDRYRFADLNSFSQLGPMTDYFVRHYTEYEHLNAYLRGYALTSDKLTNLQVPSVMLLAEDDPVIPIGSLGDLRHSAALEIIRSPSGGHCGFIENFGVRSWLDNFIVAQLNKVII